MIPIDREPLGKPDVYGRDRLLVYLRLSSAPDAAQDAAVDELERAGHPVIRIAIDDPYDLGEEFFRWEFATAVAGSILGTHPFDQPDVEASKIATRKLTDEYEKTGALPSETPIFTADGIELFTDEKNSAALAKMANGTPTLAGYLEAHLNRLNEGDYFALLAYIEMNEAHERVLQEIRQAVRDVRRVATCLEFGPRFLHSTGQAYKGGPNTGSSFRSHAITPLMCQCRDGSTPSVWSRRLRPEEILTSWWSAIAARCAHIWAPTWLLAWAPFGAASWQHWGLLQIGLGTSKIMFRPTLRVLFKLVRIRPEA